MTTALPAQAPPPGPPPSGLDGIRRLRLVHDTPQDGAGERGAAPLVGYLVLVPEGTDPAELFTNGGTRPEIRPLPHPDATPAPQAACGAVRIDPGQHVAELDGHQLDLTHLEFELLTHLVTHPNQVHSRRRLMDRVWGYDHIGDGRTVDVHIARLRRKLGQAHRECIVTVRRVGYKYVPAQQASPDTASCGRP